jgi:alpha-amylase
MTQQMGRSLLTVAAIACLCAVAASCDTTSPTFVRSLSLSIQSGGNVIRIGEAIQVRATARLSDDTEQDVTNEAQWQSLNASVGTVSSTGIVTGVRAGSGNVRATHRGASAEFSFTVQ